MMKKAIKITLSFILIGSAVFAQSLTDARKAIDAEQYQKGKALLNTLTNTQPTNSENFFYLGNLYLTTSPIYIRPDYIDSAKAAFNKGITANAEFALNYVGLEALGLCYHEMENQKNHLQSTLCETRLVPCDGQALARALTR